MEHLSFLSSVLIRQICIANSVKANSKNLIEKLTLLHQGLIQEKDLIKDAIIQNSPVDIFKNCSSELLIIIGKSFQTDKISHEFLDKKIKISLTVEINFKKSSIEEICEKLNLRKLSVDQFRNYVEYFGIEFLRDLKFAQLKEIRKGKSKKDIIDKIFTENNSSLSIKFPVLSSSTKVGDLISFGPDQYF